MAYNVTAILLSMTALIFSVLSFGFTVWHFIRTESRAQSTHQVQFVPAEELFSINAEAEAEKQMKQKEQAPPDPKKYNDFDDSL